VVLLLFGGGMILFCSLSSLHPENNAIVIIANVIKMEWIFIIGLINPTIKKMTYLNLNLKKYNNVPSLQKKIIKSNGKILINKKPNYQMVYAKNFPDSL